MTAFTTLPFCTWPSGTDSFTAAVIMSPSPAFNPVEPPSGRIICSLRAPELSATSSIDLIITAMVSIPLFDLTRATCPELRPRLPAPVPLCAQYLSASSASASLADASLRSAQHPPHALRSSHRRHKTSCCALRLARRTDGPSCASPSPQSFSAYGWRPLLPPLPCGGPAPSPLPGSMYSFPPLSFLRCGRARAL